MDAVAVIQMYEKYMYGVAGKYLGWNKSDIDDIVQESRLAIIKSFPTYKGESDKIRHWIGGVVYHTCINHIRKTKRRKFHEQESVSQFMKNQPIPKKDITEDITNIMNKLNETEKYIVKRHYFDNQPYNVIAKELNQNVDTLRTKIFRKFTKIRNNIV